MFRRLEEFDKLRFFREGHAGGLKIRDQTLDESMRGQPTRENQAGQMEGYGDFSGNPDFYG